MSIQPTLDDARRSLADHAADRGGALRAKYGPVIGWSQLLKIMDDRDFVRYPCELVFDATPLQTDEFAYPVPLGERPEDGFRLCVHPYFSVDPDRVVLIVLYQLAAVNYGSFAAPEDAEAFGAAALGIPRQEYYEALCALADEISVDHLSEG